MSKHTQRLISTLYAKYEYLATHYSGRLNQLHKLSFTQDDLAQEYRIKLLQAITTYVETLMLFKDGKIKKSPHNSLVKYLSQTLKRYEIDFIRKMNRKKNPEAVYDITEFEVLKHRYFKGENEVDLEKAIAEDLDVKINGISLLKGLKNKAERKGFIMWLMGFNYQEIDEALSNEMGRKFTNVFRDHILNIRENRDELYDFTTEEHVQVVKND